VPIRVGIIGLGQIAQGYDTPGGPAVTTHIKACLQNPRLELAWIADSDLQRAAAVRQRWGLQAEVLSPDELLSRGPDVLCLAAPDETHGGLIAAALAAPPRLILCEKPLAMSLAEAMSAIAACKAAGVVLTVNFMRRWLPHVAEWLHEARAGAFGAPVGATAVYCRGLLHNACHRLDIVGSALGSHDAKAVRVGPSFDDFDSHDLTVSAQMSVRNGAQRVPIQLVGIDGREGNHWDVDIWFVRGRLRVWNEDGIRVQTYVPSEGARPPFAPELRRGAYFHDSPARYLQFVWDDVAEHLSSRAPLRYRAEDASDGMRLLDAVAKT